MEEETFGKRLQRVRKQRGYESADALAGAVNVSKRTVENWEADAYLPRAVHLAALISILGPELDPGALDQLARIEQVVLDTQAAVASLVASIAETTNRLVRIGRGEAE